MRRSKYGAVATTVDGVRFASKKEARRYQELRLLEKAGEIEQLRLQPSYDLCVVDLTVRGKLKRAAAMLRCKGDGIAPIKVGRYVADFSYWTKDNQFVVEDAKGVKTPIYRLKKKMVLAQYGISIKEV